MTTIVVNGLFVGLIYALLGIGLVTTYRSSRVINFAYGETGMLAAFVFADLRFGRRAGALNTTDHGVLWTLPLAVLLAAGLAVATEALVVRPLRDAPRLRPLVGTFAVASIFLTFAVRRWGVNVRFAKPLIGGNGSRFGRVLIQPQQVLILVTTLAVVGGLWALYRFTAFGLRLRATALDPYAATLIGIDVNRTSALSWALAGGLSGLSAILISPLIAFNVAFMTLLAVRGLAAALVGGLTSIWGAFAAGLLLGVAEAVIGYKTPISGIADVSVAVFVLLLMLARPDGLIRSVY